MDNHQESRFIFLFVQLFKKKPCQCRLTRPYITDDDSKTFSGIYYILQLYESVRMLWIVKIKPVIYYIREGVFFQTVIFQVIHISLFTVRSFEWASVQAVLKCMKSSPSY